MLKISNLIKKYDNFIALNIDNLEIEDNSIFGLIGTNGSGKSTLLRTISGVFKQEQGIITLDEKIIYENVDVKKDILFIPDNPLANNKITVNSIFKLYKAFYNIDLKDYYHYLDCFQIPHNGNLGNFSKGMRRRTYLSIALAIKPKLLLLDEAFDGLDPEGKDIFKNELKIITQNRNIIVIIASHSLRELEDICTSYCMLDHGKIAYHSSNDLNNKNHYKYTLAFRDEFDFSLLKDQRIISLKAGKKTATIICKGNKEELEEYLNSFNPLVIDELPLSIEEVFLFQQKEKI